MSTEIPVHPDSKIFAKLLVELSELKADERNYYPTATVFANAPLALIQMGLTAQIHLLEKMLNLPYSKFPLKKK